MAGGEGLAERAGIIGIRALVGHALDTGIPFCIDGPGFFDDFLDLSFVGVNFDLEFIEDSAEVLVQLGVQDDADVLQPEAFFHGLFADAQPGDVSLADVHDALGVVDEVVNLPFQNRFVIVLHMRGRQPRL